MISVFVVSGIALGANYYYGRSGGKEAKNIATISKNIGLTIKDEKTNSKKGIRIWRKSKIEGGTEYVFQIPLGLSFKDFESKLHVFQDGLNNRKRFSDLSLSDFKQLHIDKTLPTQLKQLIQPKKTNKQVTMEYDGMLKIKVYDEPTPDFVELTDDMIKSCKGWEIPLGMSREGLVKHNMEAGHMLVAGQTTYGKTVFLKTLITTLLLNKPDDVNLHLVDLKGGMAFGRFEFLKQTKGFADNIDDALEVLNNVEREMKEQWEKFRRKGFESIRDSGIKKRHIIIIDEVGEIASSIEKDTEIKKKKQTIEKRLSEISRLGASLGYRLITCTQYPTAQIIDRQSKTSVSTTVCFKLADDTASDVVLDQSGAEKLPYGVKGKAIIKRDRLEYVQCPFISNSFIEGRIPETKREHVEEMHKQRDRKGMIGRNEKTHTERSENRQDIDFFKKS